jgi:hypothetical protein
VYEPRIVGDKVMVPADLKRLHKDMLEIEHIDHISDEMRAVIEDLWPELVCVQAAAEEVARVSQRKPRHAGCWDGPRLVTTPTALHLTNAALAAWFSR